VFLKRASNVLVLLIVVLVAIIGIAVMLFAPSIVNNFSDAVGYAAHPIYPIFSTAELGFNINGNSLTVSDTAIYKIGYYSINGADWQNFTLSGTTLSGSWLTGTATYNLPNFPTGENYVVIYSCSKISGTWNCHDNKWQLQIINITSNSNTIFPSIKFISPTPNSGAVIKTSSQQIVANITDDSNSVSSWIDFDKSLVGYWSMDSYNTNGIYDNSTYKNFGTFNGGLGINSVVVGIRGKALRLYGKESDYVNMGDKFDLGTQSWTYSFWFKEAKSDRMYILTKGASDGFNGMRIETDTNQKGSAIFGAASGYKVINGPNILLNDNTWHHIAVVFNRNGNGVWYTDGIAGSPVDISSYSNDNIDVSDNLVISGGWNTYINGSIDELMIFNRALSASEIKALYNSKINKFDSAFSDLANGQYSYTVYAIDGAGNFASSDRNFNVNAPTTCTCPSDGKACTNDVCINNVCQHALISGCCISDYDCGSNQICSSNVCVSNAISPVCDDGSCNGAETCSSCPRDCGTCSFSALRTFYISTNGSDSNSGTSESSTGAWKTLAHACASATQPGDLIHVTQGTFIETARCDLAVGVSIEGEGMKSIIKSHYSTHRSSSGIGGGAISLISSSEGTNGNQTISNLRLDGDNLMGQSDGSVAYVGIFVSRRSNVKIHDCTIIDFFSDGAVFFWNKHL
jgi:hypothetical protein